MHEKLYVVIEGIDGAGKTTLAEELASELEGKGRNVKLWNEPLLPETHSLLARAKEIEDDGSFYGVFHLYKADLFSMIFSVDRYISLMPLREELENNIVIADRSWISTLAYQQDSSITFLDSISEWVELPDLVIFLDIPPETAMKRLEKGRTEMDYFENVENLTKTRKKYLQILDELDTDILTLTNPTNLENIVQFCITKIEQYPERRL